MGVTDYIRETKSELKHVNWPNRRQAIASTALVIVASIALAAYLGFFDVLASWIWKIVV
ncbi:MAG: preprotein translocase subunit SecE [Patescibacteria group bacterium]|nr:preprotein translocase subunit SecE [Patescibacteria group bacterium]